MNDMQMSTHKLMKTLKHTLLLVLIVASTCAFGAQKKSAKTISKRFKNIPVVEVFQEVTNQADFVVRLDSVELDMDQLYTGKFRKEKPINVVKQVLTQTYGDRFIVRSTTGVDENKKKVKYLAVSLDPKKAAAGPAAKAVSNVVNKRFKEASVEEIFQEIQDQTGFVVEYDPKQVSTEKRFSGKFSDEKPANVVKNVLAKTNEETFIVKAVTETQADGTKVKKVTIAPKKKKKNVQEVTRVGTEEVVAQNTSVETHKVNNASNIDSIRTTTTSTIEHRVDTIVRIEKHKQTKEVTDYEKGSFFEPSFSVAFGANGQTLTGGEGDNAYKAGQNYGLPSATIGLQYAYFFNKNWGLGFGVEAQNYSSIAHFNEYRWADKTDSDGEKYDHIAKSDDWREHQNTIVVGVPVTLQYKHLFGNENSARRLGIFAAVGARIGFPVYNNYIVLKNSTISHTAYYDRWHLTLDQGVHEFADATPADYPQGDMQLDILKNFNAAVIGDLALLVPLTKRVSMTAGLYFTCSVNKLKDDPTAEVGVPASPGMTWTMPDYAGMANMSMTKNIHPYSVGVKVGFLINANKRKMVSTSYADTTFQYIEHMDTIKHVEMDTIMRIHKEIEEIQLGSIIFFDLNSTVPKLEPADVLEKLAAILVAHPNIRIEVNGHTCDLGKAAYNKKLSLARAQAVADELEKLGVKKEQMVIQGFSNSQPYHNEILNRTVDRRVEIKPIQEEK